MERDKTSFQVLQTAVLEEGVHGRHQYLATTAHSVPLSEGLMWLKNTNKQLLYSLYYNAPKDWRKGLFEECSKSQCGERVHDNAVESLPHIQNMQITQLAIVHNVDKHS